MILQHLNRLVMPGLLLACVTGCGPKVTRFNIVDHRASGPPEQYVQMFDQCYYCTDTHDNVDIVARHRSTDEHGVLIDQVIHLRTFWVPRPGRTYACQMARRPAGYGCWRRWKIIMRAPWPVVSLWSHQPRVAISLR